MVWHYQNIHPSFKINNVSYSFETLKKFANGYIKNGLPFEKVIGEFLKDWLDTNSFLQVKTSGSTGKPKTITLSKQAMVYSALATGEFFSLKPGDLALHGLPSQYIAGKMMLVRAMVLGLEIELVKPTATPIINSEKKYAFCAMVPLQLTNTIANVNSIKTIIVGGAPVSNFLKKRIKNMKTNVFETYGMTETITHIAVKKLNNFGSHAVKSVFKTLPNIAISQDARNCLVIDAPRISENLIITNDVVNIHSKTTFQWLGRYDNVINSGGLKLFPEQIEEKLQSKIETRFFIAKESDAILGERVVLVIENKTNILDASTFNNLEKFEIPKKVYFVDKFIESENGKIQRHKIIKNLK